MFCPNCGTRTEDGQRFCENCGTPLYDLEAEFKPENAGDTGAAGASGSGGREMTGADAKPGDKKKPVRVIAIVVVILIAVLLAAGLLILKKKELLFFAEKTESSATEEAVSDTSENGEETSSGGEEETGSESVEREAESESVEEEAAAAVLALSDAKVTLSAEGETYQISVTDSAIPADEVTWYSGDEAIAVVDESGAVTAVSAGETTITAQYDTQRVTCIIVCDLDDTAIHSYKIVIDDVDWYEASDACADAGGYLVNINSEEEFDAIIEEIGNKELTDKIFFLGAARSGDSESYYWVDASGALTGDPLNANSDAWCNDLWLSGEPSFADGDTQETVVTLFYSSSEKQWVLNDVPADILETVSYYSGKIGYICEME